MDNDSTSKEAYLFAYHKCVKAGKLTGKTMIKLLKWAVVTGWNKISASNTNRHGKQRIKQLIRKDQGVTSVDVSKTELRDFQKVARKYGVDFAVVKHLNESLRYILFSLRLRIRMPSLMLYVRILRKSL